MVPHERNRAGSAIDALSIRGTGQTAAVSFASRHTSHGPGSSYLTIAGNRSSSGGITTNRRRLHYGKTCSSSNDNNREGCSQGKAVHSRSGGSSTTTVARNISNVREGALVTGGEATKSGRGSTASTPVPPRQKGGGTGDGCCGHEKPWIAHQRPKSSRPSPRQRTRFGSARSAGCNGSRKESTSFVGRGFEGEDGGDVVTIHVCDEGRGITRDFYCQRRLLLREMKYFQSYLVKASSVHDEIDILVYCDVYIFEWLFEYMHHKSSTKKTKTHLGNGIADDIIESSALGGLDECRGDRSDGGENNGKEAVTTMPPALEVSTVVSILISSDFLQMKRLVDECLAFMGGNLTEILKLPIDLSCLSDKILVQLAKTVTLEQLAVAKDRKDKLLNRVYKKRIELDFRDISNAIHCCRHCTCLFTEKIRAVMNCRSAPPKVDFRGRLVRKHEALSPWSLSRTVTSLHRKGMSWTAMYWFLWGLTQPLFCVECGEVFLAGDVAGCHYHPQEACFPREEGVSSSGGNREAAGAWTEGVLGYYPCCRKPACRFGLESEALGCATSDHIIEEDNEDPGVLAMLKLQRANITYQAWRNAVRMALENALEGGGGKGDDAGDGPLGNGSGSGNTREGGMGGGGTETLKSGGISIVRDKMLIKRQSSAGRRSTRGQPGVPESPRNPAKNGAAKKPMKCESRTGGFRSSGGNTDSSSRGCDGLGGRPDGFSAARAEPSGTCGNDDDSRCGGVRRGGLGSRSRGKTLGRIWEVEASDVLTAREKGLLPNEHPVQKIPVENSRVEWGAFPKESSSLGEGQLRRWQTDSLRESDGLRMEKMCDDLRRRRMGKAEGSDKGGKPRHKVAELLTSTPDGGNRP